MSLKLSIAKTTKNIKFTESIELTKAMAKLRQLYRLPITAFLILYFQKSLGQSTKPKSYFKTTIVMWKDSAMGARYNKATQSVSYNKPDKNGYYKIYISDTLGNNEHQVTYAGWAKDRNQWAEDWTADGKYLFCYIEKKDYANEDGHKRKPVDATPGYGGYTDLWLVSRDGKRAWKLVNTQNNYDGGIINGATSPDGKLFTWTERIERPHFFKKGMPAGAYVIRIAQFSFDTVPHFKIIQTIKPGNVNTLNEVNDISINDSNVAFYSSYETKTIFNTPIYTMNIYSHKITKLTSKSFAQAPKYTPSGKKIVYMTGQDCDIFPFQLQGADWWIMNTDGSDKQRITYMNKKGYPECVNKYRLAGTISFMSNHSFLGGVMTKPLGLIGYTAKVTFSK